MKPRVLFEKRWSAFGGCAIGAESLVTPVSDNVRPSETFGVSLGIDGTKPTYSLAFRAWGRQSQIELWMYLVDERRLDGHVREMNSSRYRELGAAKLIGGFGRSAEMIERLAGMVGVMAGVLMDGASKARARGAMA